MGNASVQRGLFLTFPGFPSSVRAFGPATFPVGEGCLRRGSIHRGPDLTFRGPLHTRPGLRPVHPLQAGEGWSPSSVTPYGVPPSPRGKATSRRGSVHRGLALTFRGPLPFSGPCVFWHCMVQCPKIGKRQVERGAFSVQSQDPAGHYGVLCEAPEPMAPG